MSFTREKYLALLTHRIDSVITTPNILFKFSLFFGGDTSVLTMVFGIKWVHKPTRLSVLQKPLQYIVGYLTCKADLFAVDSSTVSFNFH